MGFQGRSNKNNYNTEDFSQKEREFEILKDGSTSNINCLFLAINFMVLRETIIAIKP